MALSFLYLTYAILFSYLYPFTFMCTWVSPFFINEFILEKKNIYIYIYINQTQNVQDGTSNAVTHAILSNVVTQSKMEAKH